MIIAGATVIHSGSSIQSGALWVKWKRKGSEGDEVEVTRGQNNKIKMTKARFYTKDKVQEVGYRVHIMQNELRFWD